MKKQVLFSVILLISSGESMAMADMSKYLGDSYSNFVSNWKLPSLSMPSGLSNNLPSWQSVGSSLKSGEQNAALAATAVAAGLGYGAYRYLYESRLRRSFLNKIWHANDAGLDILKTEIDGSWLLSYASKAFLQKAITVRRLSEMRSWLNDYREYL